MLFHAPSFTDPVDTTIAATYAMLAAEALGLGSCIIGSVAPLLKNNKQFKAKYGIPDNSRPGLAVVFGHPAVKYQRLLKRTFADVHFV
jgi:nitroreductase